MKIILAIGTNNENTDLINSRIIITNFIALLYAILSIPFTIITFFLIPEITFVPPLFFIVALVAIAFNYFGFLEISRPIVYFGLANIYLLYAAMIIPNGEEFYLSLFFLFMLFLPLPIVLYDLEEKMSMVIAIIIMCGLFVESFYFIDWFSVDIKPEVIEIYKHGWMSLLCYATGLSGMLVPMLFLKFSTNQAQQKTMEVLKISEQKAEELLKKEQLLVENLKQLKQAQENDQKQQWISENLANLITLLSKNSNDLKTLCEDALCHIIKIVSANQGAIYLVKDTHNNETETVLEMISCYAYNRKKHHTQQMVVTNNMADNLVTQAFLEKDKIYLTNVPKDYINITSGLGDAAPRCILIQPLKVNDTINGIIEIASFSELDKHHMEFIEKASNNIASTVTMAKMHFQTNLLLENTQFQAQELKAREEEMRQNMEELLSIQEEMVRKENEYLAKIKYFEELNKSTPPSSP